MSEPGFQVARTAPEAYERYVWPMMAPFVERVLAEVDLSPGDALLDAACGPGFVARAAAPKMGSGSRIVGLDISGEMIAAARRYAGPEAAHVDWRECSALDMPFADGEFSAVVVQQGYQFMPDHASAARELARVTAPGGRVVVTFWVPLPDQPFFGPQMEHLERLLGGPAAALSRAAFTLTPEAVQAHFEAAGLRTIHVEECRPSVVMAPLSEFLPGQVIALPVGPAFTALPVDRQGSYVEGMRDALAPYLREGDTAEVPLGAYLVSAQR